MIRCILYFFVLFLSFSFLDIQAQENDPEVAAKLQLADSYFRMGDYTKALVQIEDILVMKPHNLDAQEKKINILLQLDRSKEAISDIEEYISMYPKQPDYYYLRAIINLQKQN